MTAKRIEISLHDLKELHDRIDRKALAMEDFLIIDALVSNLIIREEDKIARLLAKVAAERASDGANEGSESPPPKPPSDGAKDDQTPSDIDDPKPKPKGHGRNGASAYANAEHFFYKLALGIIGSICSCGDGRMRPYREKIVIRIMGQPLFAAEVHHYEQAICKMCGRIIRAMGPDSVLEGIGTSYVVYGYSACAMLIVMHYFGNLPFKRLETLHEGWAIPLSDANQWQLVSTADDYLRPLYKELEKHGLVNATSLRIDDTGSMVIAIMRQIKAEIEARQALGQSIHDIRTGINATSAYLETPQGTVILFYTGRHHAGEILDQLMVHRGNSSAKLVKVTDGASKNFDHEQKEHLIEAVCNAHAFLKFQAVKENFPVQYAVAGEIYKQVFDNDDITRAMKMTPEERMRYHAEHSKPLLDKLKAECAHWVENNLVEPNSRLWEPVNFIINQWPRLIKFCEVPDVPLDTNLVEQSLIMPVRYLASSFNYQTLDGAEVGDHSMSLIATARANDLEPVAYLEYCLKNHEDLAKNPKRYLPWACRDKLTPPGRSSDTAQTRPNPSATP